MSTLVHRTSLLAALAVAAAAPLAAVSATAAEGVEGVVVRRKVAGDEPVVPPVVVSRGEGGGFVYQTTPGEYQRRPGQCPLDLESAALGEEIREWLAPQMARHDEAGWSLILRLDEGRVLLLHHPSRTYSELTYPLKEKQLQSSFARQVAREGGGDLLQQRVETPATSKAGKVGGHEVIDLRVTMVSGFGHRTDYLIRMTPHPSLGGVGFRLETTAEAVRGGGRDWLSLTGAGEGILLGMATWTEMPDGKSERREDFVGLAEERIPPDRFAAPSDYRKVSFSSDCFPEP